MNDHQDTPDKAYRQQVQTFCLMTLTVISIGFALYGLRTVLIPFVISIFVVSGISPILDLLQRRLHVDKLIAAGIAFLVGLLLMVALGFALWSSTVELAKSAPAYRQRIQELISRVESSLPEYFRAQMDPEAKEESPREQKIEQFLNLQLHNGIGQLSSALQYLLSTGVIVLIYVFFLLMGESSSARPPLILEQIDEQIREYLRLKTVISLVTGAVFGLVLALFDIPMALTFGLLAFLLNYIPNVGPLIAMVLPLPLIVLHPEATWLGIILVIAITSAVQFVSGNIIEPQVMGDSTDLHPIVILLALMFWGMLWGIIGMFLAIPVTSGLKLVLQKMEATKQLASIMAGRWE
ncbi:MAG: AI-2E family transporter [Planctomycetaceae bacterium]|nr:AI-2E family transporter [Planctomycetaceae bacterium]